MRSQSWIFTLFTAANSSRAQSGRMVTDTVRALPLANWVGAPAGVGSSYHGQDGERDDHRHAGASNSLGCTFHVDSKTTPREVEE
jgi:hypothetical protein